MLVKAVSFGQVQNVELDLSWFIRLVINLEVVPLRVALRVEVVFEPKIVFHVVDLGCLAEIARFKP